jgi:hypothetical protein
MKKILLVFLILLNGCVIEQPYCNTTYTSSTVPVKTIPTTTTIINTRSPVMYPPWYPFWGSMGYGWNANYSMGYWGGWGGYGCW